VGKTTLFNSLTGLNQHVGNWPGKTVEVGRGWCRSPAGRLRVVDLPGTYSLFPNSAEEELARDFLLGGEADVIVLVLEPRSLERHLYLALQVMEFRRPLVLALNLIDAGTCRIDTARLETELGVPIVAVSAAHRRSLAPLVEAIRRAASSSSPLSEPIQRSPDPLGGTRREERATSLYKRAQALVNMCMAPGVTTSPRPALTALDRLLTHRWLAYPIFAALLAVVLWLTMVGAVPVSDLLDTGFVRLAGSVEGLLLARNVSPWVIGPLVDGLIAGVGTVVAVMLPTMSIFFLLLALMEESGLVPRLALATDLPMQRVGSQGRHCLACLMSLGCNIPGVYAARTMSGRSRPLVLMTAALIPCNGRLGVILPLSALFFHRGATGVVLGLLILSAGAVMLSCAILSRQSRRSAPGEGLLELPPYRLPHLPTLILRTLRHRVLHVLVRAAAVAAPMMLVIWFLSNLPVGTSLTATYTARLTAALHRPATMLGLDGQMLATTLFSLPAKEVALGAFALTGGVARSLGEAGALSLADVLAWTPFTALKFLIFFTLSIPCTYTMLVIRKESGGNLGLTAMALAIPLMAGTTATLLLHGLGLLLGWR
jgi:ferrous iron transport protein B